MIIQNQEIKLSDCLCSLSLSRVHFDCLQVVNRYNNFLRFFVLRLDDLYDFLLDAAI